MRSQQNHCQIPNTDREAIPQHHMHQESHSGTDLYLPPYSPICGLLCVEFGNFVPTRMHRDIYFNFCNWAWMCPSYHFGKWTRGGGLPSPASVWRWGEVNWAVRTAVNVNLVKANKVEGMKNGSQLIHSFMPVGCFNLMQMIHNKWPHTSGIQLLWKRLWPVSCYLCWNIFIRTISSGV